MKIIRSIISILAGYLTFSVAMLLLWMAFGYKAKDVPSDAFLVFSIFCECFFAIGGGYVTALIAKRRELFHTGILAGICAILGVVTLLWPHTALPWWANAATILPIAPCFLLGGFIREKTRQTE